MISDDELRAAQTPLRDLLLGVPQDGRAVYERSPTHHDFIPYGRLCHEAAAELLSARARIAELERERDQALEEFAEFIRRYVDGELPASPRSVREQTATFTAANTAGHRIASLEARCAVQHQALTKAAETFRDYERIHVEKGAYEKAGRNATMALLCECHAQGDDARTIRAARVLEAYEGAQVFEPSPEQSEDATTSAEFAGVRVRIVPEVDQEVSGG